MLRKLNNDNGLQDWKTEHQSVTGVSNNIMESLIDRIYEYGTEGFFLMYLNKYQIIQGSDLEFYSKNQELFVSSIPCNIYFILRRPKVTIEIGSVNINNKKATLNALVQDKTEFVPIQLEFEFPEAISEISFRSEYPYNLFSFHDRENNLLTARPGALLDELQTKEKFKIPLLDYEILYIGQAYGNDGKRTAIERLSSHSTLQKIYGESLSQNPDSDIFIMLTHFSQVDLLSAFGSSRSNPINEKRDNERAFKFFKEKEFNFSQKQKINFTEAALIKYFQPKYNIEFKVSFPSKNHKSYSECYDLDIRAMAIELETSELKSMIYTKESGKKEHHFMHYSFDSREDRFNLFSFMK